MKEFWNERYAQIEYAYGEAPNVYLQENLAQFSTGRILFAAEGEGRNAVFAATLGWEVAAFDLSESGKIKAEALAKKNSVSIDYQVSEFGELSYPLEKFDAIALIYAHFPAAVKSTYHKKLISYLKKGGIVIFEAFSKNHLHFQRENPHVGGPQSLEMLFSTTEIEQDFANFEIIELEEKIIQLREGVYHQGEGSVIRFIGRKKD